MRGSWTELVTAPAVDLLSLAEAKEHLRVDHTDEDDLITAYVAAVSSSLEAGFGEIGRALITQTWKLYMPSLPSDGRIVLPFPPLQSVTSVTYRDTDNAEQTLSASAYRVVAQSESGLIEQVDGAAWPSTFNRADAVTITFVCGYGDAASDVPEGIRMIARLLLAHWYENRQAVAVGVSVDELPMAVRSLLMKYRIARSHI